MNTSPGLIVGTVSLKIVIGLLLKQLPNDPNDRAFLLGVAAILGVLGAALLAIHQKHLNARKGD